jgi:hypothetical protein
MEKDCQESSRKKRMASLRLVDPHRDAKAPRPSVKGATAAAAMPPPAVPAEATRRVPSPSRADEVAGAKEIGEACRDLSVDDHLVGDVDMFDAQMVLMPSGECSYCYVDFV